MCESNELDKIVDCEFFSFVGCYLAKVVKCYDGDTVHCIFKYNGGFRKFRIRMAGYDSCEMKQSRKQDESIRIELKTKAEAAKKRLEELVLGKNIYLFCCGQDKYGRILGKIKIGLLDDKFVNDIMIEEGFGYVYNGGKKKTEEEQLKIENE